MAVLAHKFNDPELDRTLQLFLRITAGLFRDRLISVVLQGSLVFNDLAPGYGDLDFLAVIDGDLASDDLRDLVEIRKPLRRGDHGILALMLEGPFLPRHTLNPACLGRAFCWGTSGERPWEKNNLGALALSVIREKGIVIRGEDIRREIPVPAYAEMLGQVRDFCESAVKHGQPGRLHSIDWLLTAARLLLWLKEGRLSSKSEAADWGALHARGAWRECLPRARQLRLNPSAAASHHWKQWLDGLETPIRQAVEELQQELAAEGT